MTHEPRGNPESHGARADADDGAGFADVAGNSVSVAAWTAVSRLTGFIRVATIAAVLGPTFFGNLFQATNLLPNVTYEFLTGSLFVSLLVPALVRHVDSGDRDAVERLAGGFLGVVTLGFAMITVVIVSLAPWVVRLLTLGVDDPTVVTAQQRAGWPLLAMLMPQVMLYGLAGTGVAVQNVNGRFALAAAAPALENVGVIATMLVSALLFGTGGAVGSVPLGQLTVLGLGTTSAVGLHAAAQWWGAWRVGVTLRPRAGWRDAEVVSVLRLFVPSLGYAGLRAARLLGILIVAGSIPGGVVAFQMALNFFNLPVALGAKPFAAALLPRLSRLYQSGAAAQFRLEWARGVAVTLFLTVPAAVAYVVLAEPLARGVSFGEMSGADGVTLVAASIMALGFGMIGDANFVVGTHASYARLDPRSPFHSMFVRTAVTVVGMVLGLVLAEGVLVLVVLGLSVTVADLIGSTYLDHRIRRRLPEGGERVLPSLGRAAVGSIVMVIPAYLLIEQLSTNIVGPLGPTIALLAGATVGLLIFLGVQWAWRSPELATLVSGFSRRGGAQRR